MAPATRLLIAVADRLRGDLRTADLAARLGGDEFGVLLPRSPTRPARSRSPSACWPRSTSRSSVADVTVEVGASIGIAIDTAAMRSVDDLLGDADIAMYQAKAQGKGRHHVFDAAERRRARRDGPRPGWSADRRSAAATAPALAEPRLEPGQARLVGDGIGRPSVQPRSAKEGRWRSRSSRCTRSSAPASSLRSTSSRSATGR